jgi:hypothetical protein
MNPVAELVAKEAAEQKKLTTERKRKGVKADPAVLSLGKRERLKPRVVVTHLSPNHSERSGVPINLAILHDTEGGNIPDSAEDLVGLGNFFATPIEASCAVATDSDGNSGRYVLDKEKAWHCAAYNSASLGIEQIGFASQSRVTWLKNWKQLRETARWLAAWSIHYGIPLRRGAVSNGVVTKAGVLRHMDLGVAGGGHSDPGPNYPFGRVLVLARLYKAARRK